MDGLDRMNVSLTGFIAIGPWLILGSFIVSFVFTKLLASQRVYELTTEFFLGSKLKRAAKVRNEWRALEKLILKRRPLEKLREDEKWELEQAQLHYREQIQHIYRGGKPIEIPSKEVAPYEF